MVNIVTGLRVMEPTQLLAQAQEFDLLYTLILMDFIIIIQGAFHKVCTHSFPENRPLLVLTVHQIFATKPNSKLYLYV